jgi:hypothetical protein
VSTASGDAMLWCVANEEISGAKCGAAYSRIPDPRSQIPEAKPRFQIPEAKFPKLHSRNQIPRD